MAMRRHHTCYCGEPGDPDRTHNFVDSNPGRKGGVDQARFCCEEHERIFAKQGDMYALFHGGGVKLKATDAELQIRQQGMLQSARFHSMI